MGSEKWVDRAHLRCSVHVEPPVHRGKMVQVNVGKRIPGDKSSGDKFMASRCTVGGMKLLGTWGELCPGGRCPLASVRSTLS